MTGQPQALLSFRGKIWLGILVFLVAFWGGVAKAVIG